MARWELVLSGRDENLSVTLRKAQFEINLTKMAAQGLSSAFAALRIGLMISAGAFASFALPALMATKVVGDYEQSLRRATAIGEGFTGRTQELGDTIMDAAIKYGVSSDDIAAGVVEFAKAGFDYNDVVNNLIIPTTQMAIMNQTEFATAAEVSTVAWQLFGEDVGDATKLITKLHVAANASLMDIEDLSSAFEYAGSTFKVAGIGVDEFLATMGALSQVAYKSGQTVGTFFSRLMTDGEILEDMLGVNGIVENGVVNTTVLMKELIKVQERGGFTQDELNQALELGGHRSFKVFAALSNVGEEYIRILERVINSSTELADDSEIMAMSITQLKTSIMETFLAPLKDPTFMAKLADMLSDLKDTLTSGDFSENLLVFMETSVAYMTDNMPEIIGMLTDVLELVTELQPTLSQLSDSFLTFGRFVAGLNPSIVQLGASLLILNKILPMSVIFNKQFFMGLEKTKTSSVGVTKALQLTTLQVGYMAASVAIATASMLGLMAGLNLIVGGRDTWTRVLGGLTILFSLLAAKLWTAAVAAESLRMGVLAVATLGAAAAAGIVGWREMQKDIRAEAIPQAAVGGYVERGGLIRVHEDEVIVPKSQVASIRQPYDGVRTSQETSYYDYRTIHIYDTDKNDLERVLREEGQL